MQETWVRSLGREDPLGEGMATRSSILAWRIPWTEEPGGLQSMGSQSRTGLCNYHACIRSIKRFNSDQLGRGLLPPELPGWRQDSGSCVPGRIDLGSSPAPASFRRTLPVWLSGAWVRGVANRRLHSQLLISACCFALAVLFLPPFTP